jgi:hypothetical protein
MTTAVAVLDGLVLGAPSRQLAKPYVYDDDPIGVLLIAETLLEIRNCCCRAVL